MLLPLPIHVKVKRIIDRLSYSLSLTRSGELTLPIVRLAGDYVYPVAIVGSYRWLVLPKGVAIPVTNSIDASLCVDSLEDTISSYEAHEIFNTDQWSQFINESFAKVFTCEGVQINMDGRGRARQHLRRTALPPQVSVTVLSVQKMLISPLPQRHILRLPLSRLHSGCPRSLASRLRRSPRLIVFHRRCVSACQGSDQFCLAPASERV